MAMVDVDRSFQFSADSQPKSTGLVWGLAVTRRSVYIHQTKRVNSRNDFGHDDNTINIVVAIIIISSSITVQSIMSWTSTFVKLSW